MNYYFKVLENYATFNGRARRKEYWFYFLINMLISAVFIAISSDPKLSEVAIFSLIYSLAVLIPSIAVAVRRMHDVGKIGWFLLIPIYNLILALT